jgi:rubrerythrin
MKSRLPIFRARMTAISPPDDERLSRPVASLKRMSDVFRKIGRRAEQFKQNMDAAAVENADYECRECEARFAVNPEQCPDCGSEEIIPTENKERTA